MGGTPSPFGVLEIHVPDLSTKGSGSTRRYVGMKPDLRAISVPGVKRTNVALWRFRLVPSQSSARGITGFWVLELAAALSGSLRHLSALNGNITYE